eukprot:349141_1
MSTDREAEQILEQIYSESPGDEEQKEHNIEIQPLTSQNEVVGNNSRIKRSKSTLQTFDSTTLNDQDFYKSGTVREVGSFWYIDRLSNIDLVTESMAGLIELCLCWQASKSEYIRYKTIEMNEEDTSSYKPDWIPTFVIMNGDCEKTLNPDWQYKILTIGDTDYFGSVITKSKYKYFNTLHYLISGRFLQSFDVHNFPLDVQDLQVTSEMSETTEFCVWTPWFGYYGDDGYLGALSIKYSGVSEYYVRNGFIEYDISMYDDQGFGRLNMRIKIERIYGVWFWKIFFFLFFIELSTFGVFTIDSDSLGDRYSLLFTLLLSAVAFQFVVSSSLPSVSYLTLLDSYVLGSFAFLIGVSTSVYILAIMKPDDPQKWDQYVVYGTGIIFIIGHSLYLFKCWRAHMFELKKINMDHFDYLKNGFYDGLPEETFVFNMNTCSVMNREITKLTEGGDTRWKEVTRWGL